MENEIILKIESKDAISLGESFSFAKQTSILLRDDKEKGQKLIIYILDNWAKVPGETISLWTDLIESAGFYPYIQKEKLKLDSLAGEVRKEYHLSENLDEKYFHEEQKYLKNILEDGKNLIVSAPTSFGKSLLIEEMVASKKFKNIVVIQPTLALLDETRKKLKKYQVDYKIVVRTSQAPSGEKGNIFLLTAERVTEYRDFPVIDFFVIDEFYKLSTERDDERSDTLNNAFYRLLQQNPRPQFYLLGPNIDGISAGFAERYNAIFYKTDYSLIQNKVIDVYSEHKDKFSKPRKYKKFKEDKLFELLLDLKNEQSIIYCSSPSRVRELAQSFCIFLKEKSIKKGKRLPLSEWIEENVHPEWNLINFLDYQVGINDGAMQKHINSSMIDYFNEKRLKYMFCTTTIIEGVNTSAKNVVFFDNKKGRSTLIDYFDYSNIKGRSGRMMIHYIGKIFNFNPPPKKDGEMVVDIPFFQQSPIKDEVLNSLHENDIKSEVRETDQYIELMSIPLEQRELFRKTGVSVKGQKNILDAISNIGKSVTIKRNKYQKSYQVHDLIAWNGEPSYDQLQFLIELCWDNLIKKGETTSPMTKSKLTLMTFKLSVKKNIFALIKDDYAWRRPLKENINKTNIEVLNESIRNIFSISKHWFQYKVPKWLSVMNEIQSYVCEKNNVKPGSYTFYASQIENDFVPDYLNILIEYGIPKSAVMKIQKITNPDMSEEELLSAVSKYSHNNDNKLIEYEKNKIVSNL